jgi:iron(III) transport system permease protein
MEFLIMRDKRGIRFHNGWSAFQLNSVLAGLVLLTVYPLGCLVLNSLGITSLQQRLSFQGYWEVLTEPQFATAFYNTFGMALAITLFSLALGLALAWTLIKTDLQNKRIWDFLIMLTYMVPSYIMAIALIEILGPVGILGKLFQNGEIPFKIYSLSGVILVMTIHLYPIAYLTVANALHGCERSLEEAALLDGAGQVAAFFKIILPAILPSVFSAGLFIFTHSVACFGVAALLALPARQYILPTYIYIALSSLKFEKATAMAVLLAFLAGLLFAAQRWLGKAELKMVPSANYGDRQLKLGDLALWVKLGIGLFFGVTVIAPLGVMVIVSLLKVWGLTWEPSNFTWDNYRQIFFGGSRIFKAIRNSMLFGAVAATAATFIGSIAIYLGVRFGGWRGKVADFLLSWPMALPEVVLAVAAILAWIRPPLKLYGTPGIIIVTYTAAGLPFVVRSIRGLLDSLEPELEEVAWTYGASVLTGFRRVVLPLIATGLKAGWLFTFLFALHEIPVSTLLCAPGTETVGAILFGLRNDSGGLELISALAVVILGLVIGGRLAIQKTAAGWKD